MKLLRHTDEWVGLLVILSVVLFAAATLYSGLLGDWFRPTTSLRVLLPPTGSGGLAPGAGIEVLGTHVGTVRRIVIDADKPMYADVELEVPAIGYIRRDSVAVIKKTFGVAGAAFLDITRGTGEPLDWHFAVIEASTQRAPTDDVNALIDELKKKVIPVLDDAGRGMKSLADTVEGIGKGRGSLGQLLSTDDVANQIGKVLANLVAATDLLNAELAEVRTLTASVTRSDGIPALLHRADATLAAVQAAVKDLAAATPQLPAISRSLAASSANLPALLSQTQQLVADMAKLSAQLRNTWPLSSSVAADTRRLSPRDVRP